MSEGNAAVSGAAQDTGTDPTLAQGVVAPPQDSAAGSAAPLTEPDVDAEEEIDDVDAVRSLTDLAIQWVALRINLYVTSIVTNYC